MMYNAKRILRDHIEKVVLTDNEFDFVVSHFELRFRPKYKGELLFCSASIKL